MHVEPHFGTSCHYQIFSNALASIKGSSSRIVSDSETIQKMFWEMNVVLFRSLWTLSNPQPSPQEPPSYMTSA